YRLLIGMVGLVWIASLLIDPKVRVVRSPLHAPLIGIVLVSAASIALNVRHIEELQVSQDVLKQFTFLLSFVLVFLLVVSVVHSFEQIDFLLKILVGGGAILSVFALVELWTGV